MAEKGIIVDDDASGESVACRDAIQQDDDLNNRIVQLTDRAARPITYQRTTPLRSAISVTDALDIDPLPAGISGALLDVSDAESCVVWCLVNHGSSSTSTSIFTVTPVIVSEDATPVAVALLPPFQIYPVYPKKMVNSTALTDVIDFSGYKTPTIAHGFPTFGAKQIGFHVTRYLGDSSVTLDLFAAPSSGVYRNTAIDQSVIDETWGTVIG